MWEWWSNLSFREQLGVILLLFLFIDVVTCYLLHILNIECECPFIAPSIMQFLLVF